jgi:hypothetical protein
VEVNGAPARDKQALFCGIDLKFEFRVLTGCQVRS